MRLLRMTGEDIQALIDGMEKEAAEIKKSALKFSWFMRGGMSYEDVLNTSAEERELISNLIEENLETTKTSKLPFF
jgi:hypothetical protein